MKHTLRQYLAGLLAVLLLLTLLPTAVFAEPATVPFENAGGSGTEEDPYLIGNEGVVGYSNGTITDCYNTGSVTGNEVEVFPGLHQYCRE